jgi:hypothetical protein
MSTIPTLRAWTDYPLTALGDEPNVEAPVRQVIPIQYDNNKYVKVMPLDGRGLPYHNEATGENLIVEFKAGYLYATQGRYGQVRGLDPGLINQKRWVQACSCGAKCGDACRTFKCEQLVDRYKE